VCGDHYLNIKPACVCPSPPSGGALGNSLVEVPIERQMLEAIMAAGPAGERLQGGRHSLG
jgi:hypothetical protein